MIAGCIKKTPIIQPTSVGGRSFGRAGENARKRMIKRPASRRGLGVDRRNGRVGNKKPLRKSERSLLAKKYNPQKGR